MKVIIAGGGTGGHVFPAISIAEEIIHRNGGSEVLFVGTRKGLECRIIPEKGYRIEYIDSGGIIGKNPLQQISGFLNAVKGVINSFKLIRDFDPDAVIGVGGYASGPTVLSAFLSFKPTFICEQNSIPGITNRILSKFAKRIFITFENSKKYFPEKKTHLTGNPIRKCFSSSAGNQGGRNGKISIFILGGSQGSNRLNQDIPKCFSKIEKSSIRIVHQTGEKDYHMVMKAYEESGIDAEVYKFIDNIKDVYESTDLIICRSGAGTLSEITAVGIPAILVPFSYAAHDHQLLNAMYMEKKGAAVIVEENNINEQTMTKALNRILKNGKLYEMSEKSKSIGKPNAAADIVDEIEAVTGRYKCTGK